jgi:SagB-type dehydrogenase family enzyme
MEETRYDHLSQSDQSERLPAPPLEKPFPEEGPFIPLPLPHEIIVPTSDLRDVIEARRSVRRYGREPIEVGELSYLLWCTQGVVFVQDPYYTLRNVPSAGGRHSFETYLLVNRVSGIDPGIYRYLAFSHRLHPIAIGVGLVDQVMAACLGQAFVRASAVTFIWSSVIYRMAWRYSERAYRLVHLDAGHVCQNLYLSASQIGCGVCAIAAFDDEQIAKVLGIDGEEEFVVYCATVGRIDEESRAAAT